MLGSMLASNTPQVRVLSRQSVVQNCRDQKVFNSMLLVNEFTLHDSCKTFPTNTPQSIILTVQSVDSAKYSVCTRPLTRAKVVQIAAYDSDLVAQRQRTLISA